MNKLILFLILGLSFIYPPFSFGDVPLESAAPIPTTPDLVQGYEVSFLKMGLTFIALIVGIFCTVWILKRLSQGHLKNMNSNRAIKILEKRALSAKTMLYLVEIGEKQTLVAESHLEVKSLATLSVLPEEEV
ncbi:MAG: flagellar biosynthetic protein FliO [Rhabdochlamydiaceae bacterium]|jgi:flagellar biogenesis protein FliO